MDRAKIYIRAAAALALSLLWFPGVASADSLVTTDGDTFVGPVTRTAEGYTVKTSEGVVDIPARKVKGVLYDHPPAAAPTPPAAAPKANGIARKPIDPRTLAALIEQGETAMAAAEYADARDAFKDALSIDRKNALAGRGLGYAYIALGKAEKALDPLEIAALTPPLDRSLVIALASAQVANHNMMRAVKYLVPYLQAHSKPVDEKMLNALGVSLSQTDSSAKKSPLFKDGAKLYYKLDADLETTMTGKRRWGIEWRDTSDVEKKEAERAKAQSAADSAYANLQSADNALTLAQNDLNRLSSSLGKRDDSGLRQARQKVSQTADDRAKAQASYDAAIQVFSDAPKPTFPAEITVDTADLVMPGNPTIAAASPTAVTPSVASAEPVRSESKPMAPKSDPVGDAKPPSPPADNPPPPVRPAPPRHVTRYAVAFAIAPDVLVTAGSAVEDASSITITTADGKSMSATVLRAHHSDGLALLKVDAARLPCVALSAGMGDSSVSCIGFPDVDLFDPKPRSMDVAANATGDAWTVRFDTPPRLPGGPLMQKGQVVGVELGDRDSDLSAVPAATLKELKSLVRDSANQASLTTDPRRAVVQVMAER